MFEDSTYLHFILFFSSAVNDAFLRRSFGKTTYYHMGRTINSLSEKVARAELDDSTIAVVSSLVIVTALFTDYKAAKAHVAGLKRIVQLRGGLDAFRHNLSLYIKLARYVSTLIVYDSTILPFITLFSTRFYTNML